METLLRLLSAATLVVAIAACGSNGATATPRPVPSVTGSIPAASDTAAPSSGSKPGQTDTAWGRIWDALPGGFPTIPGARPDENAAGGPASAVFVVQGVDPAAIATSLQAALKSAGYTSVGSLQPLEDGSVVLDMKGSPEGCAVQVSATPTGGVTTVRILYGAACPFG